MADTMKAVVYHAPGDIRVETQPLPECGTDELRVKVDACAVCGTDLKAFKSGNPRIKAPQVMGHEFTGCIDCIGDDVGGFSMGERIVMATSVSCGNCYSCRQGWTNLCAEVAPMGFTYAGGMADYVVIPERALRNGHVVKVPEGVEAVHAALAEPLSCAVNSIENCGVQKGDTVVVVGAGPMGLLNTWAARAAGARQVWLAELNGLRLKQAKAFDIDRLIDPAKEDLQAAIMDATGGIGADVVIVAAPAAAPQEQALAMVRKRGTVCLFASLPSGKSMLSLDSRLIHYGELRVVGSSDSTPRQVARAVEMLVGDPETAEKLVTHRLSLDAFHDAFDLMQSGEALRVVLNP